MNATRLMVAKAAAVTLIAAAGLVAQQSAKRLPGPAQAFGPVHTIRDEESTFTNENGEWVEGPRRLVMTYTFNEDGTKQERTLYLPNGSFVHRSVETYDPDGRPLETSEFNAAGELERRIVNNYDDQKKLTDRIIYLRDGSVLSRMIVHRENGQVRTESLVYNNRGDVIGGSNSTSDPKARTSESTSYSSSATIHSRTAVVPNANGTGQIFESSSDNAPPRREEWINQSKAQGERIRYNPDGSIQQRERIVREFDAVGNFVRGTSFVAQGDSQTFVPSRGMYRTLTYYEKQ